MKGQGIHSLYLCDGAFGLIKHLDLPLVIQLVLYYVLVDVVYYVGQLLLVHHLAVVHVTKQGHPKFNVLSVLHDESEYLLVEDELWQLALMVQFEIATGCDESLEANLQYLFDDIQNAVLGDVSLFIFDG